MQVFNRSADLVRMPGGTGYAAAKPNSWTRAARGGRAGAAAGDGAASARKHRCCRAFCVTCLLEVQGETADLVTMPGEPAQAAAKQEPSIRACGGRAGAGAGGGAASVRLHRCCRALFGRQPPSKNQGRVGAGGQSASREDGGWAQWRVPPPAAPAWQDLDLSGGASWHKNNARGGLREQDCMQSTLLAVCIKSLALHFSLRAAAGPQRPILGAGSHQPKPCERNGTI